MFVIKGNTAVARVYQDEDQVENTAKEQIGLVTSHVAFKGQSIAVMPDCHYGSGCVVGFTSTLGKHVIPNVIGGDIGCGVLALCTGQKSIDFDKLDRVIRDRVPSGFRIRDEAIVDDFFKHDEEFVTELGTTVDKINKSLGTLGGGNHFIEVDKDPEGYLWLVIHSGSRNIGLRVAQYYQKKAKALCEAMGTDVPKGLEYLPLEFGGGGYLYHMDYMQTFARMNREFMADIICDWMEFNSPINTDEHIESVHNYIDFSEAVPVMRKGAISAKENEQVIIPLNMRDGCIVGRGKGNSKWKP